MNRILLSLAFMTLLGLPSTAQTSGFTYQGKLTDGGNPANGQYDLIFRLFDLSGTQVGSDVIRDDVQATAGIFSVILDFGNSPFTAGAADTLEIAVRPGTSTGAFTTLTPRQPLTSSPYAIKSTNTASADSLSAACVLCVTDGHIQSLDGGKVTGVVANSTNALTAINVSGIVGIANGGTGSSTKSFVDLSTGQSNIGGNKTFTGAVAVTGGSGVFNGNGSGLTNLNGASIVGGTVTSTQLSADALPNTNSLRLLGSLRWDLLKPQNTFNVGSGPNSVAFDGTNIWVGIGGGTSITKLRASDGANLGSVNIGQQINKLAFDGTHIWVTNSGPGTVTKVRASDGSNLGAFAAVASASGIAFDGANIWVTSVSAGTVVKIQASDGANLGTFAVGSFPTAAVFDGANIWVSNNNSGNVTKLRASDGANLGTFPVVVSGAGSRGMAFDGANIWVASAGGQVTKLRASDGANLGMFPLPGFIEEIAFDGVNIWATSRTTNSVIKVRVSDGVILGTFTVGLSPFAICFDGTNMWTANNAGSSVTRLPPAFPQQ